MMKVKTLENARQWYMFSLISQWDYRAVGASLVWYVEISWRISCKVNDGEQAKGWAKYTNACSVWKSLCDLNRTGHSPGPGILIRM